MICKAHNPRQHRDGKEPWCKECGLTADYREPKGGIGPKPEAPAGAGEVILVLAVSAVNDGEAMRRAIKEVKPGAEIVVATGPDRLQGRHATQFVMTEAFAGQRSIRTVMAAERATHRAKAGRASARVQKGL